MIDYKAARLNWPKGDLLLVSRAVTEIYVNALNSGNPPKVAVMKAFKTSPATAGRMIEKARQLGILKVSGKGAGGRPRKGTEKGWELQKLVQFGDKWVSEFTSEENPGLEICITCGTVDGNFLKIIDIQLSAVDESANITAMGIRDVPFGHLADLTKIEIGNQS